METELQQPEPERKNLRENDAYIREVIRTNLGGHSLRSVAARSQIEENR